MRDASTARSGAARSGLYRWVFLAIALGVALGVAKPGVAESMRPLGDLFVRLVKVLLAPVVFCTVVTGIASAGDLRRIGRVGLRALVYFEVTTTLALGLGLAVVHVAAPGAGIHADPAKLDTSALTTVMHGKSSVGLLDHILSAVPESFLGAFAGGDVLQVLVVAVLFGVALASLGDRGQPVLHGLHALGAVFFRIVALVMRAAPVGAFGAMAYTVGHFGLGSLGHLARLLTAFYVTAAAFVFVVLGLVARVAGFSILRLLVHLREELFVVLGTSSSESALPRLMDKLEGLGCRADVVRLVVPTGYSFNLDGTSIYLTMAAVFVAQATDTPLSMKSELGLLAVLLLTSKGAAAVTGGGFVTLAATLQSTGAVPVAGLSLLLGVDRFMSEARALTNLVGNAVATIVVAKWEGALDVDRLRQTLSEAPSRVAPAPR